MVKYLHDFFSLSNAKRALALAIFLGLVFFVGKEKIFETVYHIQPIYIFHLALISIILIWLSSVKWQLFVKASKNNVTIKELMRYYTMSYFFNLFMPSTIGGDVARSYHLGKKLGNQSTALAATIVERITGFLAMALISLIFISLGTEIPVEIFITILSLSIFTIIACISFLFERPFQLLYSLANKILQFFSKIKIIKKISDLLNKLEKASSFARNNNSLLVKALILSLMFHFIAIVNTYVCALAVGWTSVSFIELCLVVPLVLLVSSLPITPSAIGLQEGAFMYFLAKIGATPAEGLGVGLILRAKNLIIALLGYFLWLVGKKK